MDTYRAFILDDNDRIIRAEVLPVTCDEDAMNAARPFWMEADVEIWRGSKRIGRVLKGGDTARPAAGEISRL